MKQSEMQDVILVTRSSHSQLSTFKYPVIKLELKHSRFIVSDIVAKALSVDDNGGLMFGFNQAAKTGYVMKDNEDDAFRLSRKDSHTLRFTSKDLMQFFDRTFSLSETGGKSFVFSVDLQANSKGFHAIFLETNPFEYPSMSRWDFINKKIETWKEQQFVFQANQGKGTKALEALINAQGLLDDVSDEDFEELLKDLHR